MYSPLGIYCIFIQPLTNCEKFKDKEFVCNNFTEFIEMLHD